MVLFSQDLLDDLRRLPGASHSFLKQLATPEGEPVRALLEGAARAVVPAVEERWAEVLTSLDNRRFFQGYAEAATALELVQAGWRVTDMRWPGPVLEVQDPSGRDVDLLVLSFIRQVRPGPDAAVIERLRRSLDRVGSRSRIAVLVRRWLPHDFDPEPVRRAIDMWLREVDRGGWDGRYAAYDDEHVSLEFALTGERARQGDGVVAFTLGPFDGQRTLEVLEGRIVYELDAWRLRGGGRERPVLVACVADQPWRLSPGYQRELFLGKPDRTCSDGEVTRFAFEPEYAPCLFRDPHYRCVSGVLLSERPAADPTALRTRAFLNPWTTAPIAPEQLGGMACMGVESWEGTRAVTRWFNR